MPHDQRNRSWKRTALIAVVCASLAPVSVFSTAAANPVVPMPNLPIEPVRPDRLDLDIPVKPFPIPDSKLPPLLDIEIKPLPFPLPAPGGNSSTPSEAELNQAVEGASEWAKNDVKKAIALGLTTDAVLGNYQQSITRKHFAGLAVKIMESLTGQITPAVPASASPFTDTTDSDVLKAHSLSVVRGVSETLFSPDTHISRQEICIMLERIFHLTGKFPASGSQRPDFADQADIAEWADGAVRYVANAGIVNGVGDNRFDPLGTTTREQAIVLILRTYLAVNP